MSIAFIVVRWCLVLLTTQASASVSANSMEVSTSEVPSANTTVSKVKDKNETSEETAEPFFFNPEGNITFSGNSSLLIKEDVSLPQLMTYRSRRKHKRRKSKGKRRYFISEFKASWLKAMQSCRSRDMQLITINCKSEQKVLHELLKENRIKTPIWTSGSDNGGGKEFYWISSGSKLKYKNWRRGQPDGMDRGSKHGSDHCLQVSPEDYYDWNDYTCFTKNYFVCEKDV